MSFEEKRTWVYLVASVAAYGVYVAIVVGRTAHTPVAQVSYVPALLATTGASIAALIIASIVASIAGQVAVGTAGPGDGRRADVRDKEISRFAEHASRWCVVAGATTALVMAMARWDDFWIANAAYLGFVLWAVAGSALRLVAYRRGL
jgi:hypothetical protein